MPTPAVSTHGFSDNEGMHVFNSRCIIIPVPKSTVDHAKSTDIAYSAVPADPDASIPVFPEAKGMYLALII